MAIALFGVTAAMLRATHFPHLGEFSSSSVPTSDVVTAIIERKAARLAGRLRREGVDASTLTDGSASYAIAQDLLLIESAIDVQVKLPSYSPDAIKGLRDELAERMKELDEDSWETLGAEAPSELPDGPHHHIDNHSLETEDEADISPVADKLRASDML